MIPFEELSAALDRWRIRSGLPVVSADLPIVPDAERVAMTPMPFVMPASAPATQPRTAPPGAAPRPGTDSDEISIGDADVVEDDEYANEGGDFAMSFDGQAPPPAAAAAAAAPLPPAQLYDEGDGEEGADYQATYVANDAPAYQDPAYDAPQPLDVAPEEPAPEEEEEEDWSRMPNFPGNAPGPDTIDGEDDDGDPKR